MSVPDPRRREEAAILIDGPWTHRAISANGIRFHAAEMGHGPLVLLLHGFPQFWWTWRHQLVTLAEAGYRAVAPDLRGYGASDKTPRGYDPVTLAADVAGMVRALGESEATIVGHDWGGVLAWCMGVLHRPVVRRLVVVSVPHPLRARAAVLADPRGQLSASRYAGRFQLPWHPERWLVEDDAANVGALLRTWGRPGWPDPETERRYRDAIQVQKVAHSALEYYRWWFRSQFRPDGHRFARTLRAPVTTPTLQLHGALDPVVLPRSAQGSGRFVAGAYEWRLLPDAGHFPQEEYPQAVDAELVRWMKDA